MEIPQITTVYIRSELIATISILNCIVFVYTTVIGIGKLKFRGAMKIKLIYTHNINCNYFSQLRVFQFKLKIIFQYTYSRQ